jgi:hypothetical protein
MNAMRMSRHIKYNEVKNSLRLISRLLHEEDPPHMCALFCKKKCARTRGADAHSQLTSHNTDTEREEVFVILINIR